MLQAQIYIDADQMKGTQPLQDFILHFLIQHSIKGATVFGGRFGFGGSQQMKRPRELFSFDETPLMVTFTDETEKVRNVLTELRKVWKGGFIVTLQVEEWNK